MKQSLKTITIIMLFIMLILLTACQATPDKEPVVNKGGNWIQSMVEKSTDYGEEIHALQGSPQPLLYDCPEKLSYSLDGENISVTINADVLLPKYKMPIVSLEEQNISFGQIESLIHILGWDDEELYHFDFVQMARTKKHIQRAIERQLQDIVDLKEEKIDTSVAEDYLNQLYESLRNAPENYKDAAEMLGLSHDEISKPFSFTSQNYNNQEYAFIVGESNALYPFIRINAMQGDNQVIDYSQSQKVGYPTWDNLSYIDDNLFSLKEAEKIAEPVAEVLAGDLKLIQVGIMGKNKDNDDPRQPGFVFIYKRVLNGVESNYVTLPDEGWRGAAAAATGMAFDEDLSYSIPASEEGLIITVNEEGVYFLLYDSPRKVKEVLSYEASLLPFEQIKTRFDQYILMHGFSENYQLTLTIKKAKLGMIDIKVADKNDQVVSIPVWDFYGDYALKTTTATNEDVYETANSFQVLLTINAIDGSIIDRAKGY